MDWTTQTDIIRRIVAVLLVLADLADRARHASRPERCRVLGILRQAEIVAQVYDPARERGAPLPTCRPFGQPMASLDDDDPSGAARLALSLRALSLAWAALLAWMLRIVRRRMRSPLRTRIETSRVPARAFAGPRPPDTS